MNKRMLAACVSLVAFAAFAVVPAIASASPELQTSAGAKVATGTAIKAFSSNLVFSSSKGNLECAENTLNGKVTENSGTSIKGEISSATFKASGGGSECKTSIPGGTATITPEGLPWCLSTIGTDEVTITGCSGTIGFSAQIKVFGFTVATCKFAANPDIVATYKTSTSPLVLTIKSGPFKYVSGNTEFCSSTGGTLSGSFTVTTSAGGALKVV